MDLSEYKRTLQLDPEAPNNGTWYARGLIHHNGKAFTKGQQLPADLTNGEVALLLDVNALTSVAPKENDVVVPPHSGAPNQQGVVEGGVAHGNSQTATDAPVAPDAPTGATRLDENGNEVALDENGNPVE